MKKKMHARTLTHTLPVPFKIDISTTTVQSTSQQRFWQTEFTQRYPGKEFLFFRNI